MRETILVTPLLAVLVAMFVASPALAAPGDLDATFGGDGVVTTDFTRRGDTGTAIAIQPDGKLVVAGASAWDSRDARFAIARYDTDGSLDTTFGADGRVSTDLGRHGEQAWGVAVQSDGKIVAAGDARLGSGNSAFAVARYEADGTLDPTFGGGDGRVLTQFTRKDDGVGGLALQPDGKILVSGGSRSDTRRSKLALARYESDGSPDTTFGGDGRVAIDLSRREDYAAAVIVQPDGKIVVGGHTRWARFVLVRFSADGSLDETFGTDGKVATAMTSENSFIQALAVQSDMKIVAAGHAFSGPNHGMFALGRYNPDGTLDDTFGGGDGKTLTDLTPYDDLGFGVALQADGKIAVAGVAGACCDSPRFAVVRYQVDGSLDPTFGAGGTVTTDIRGFDWSRGIVVQDDGKIVVSGGAGSRFGVVRYLGA